MVESSRPTVPRAASPEYSFQPRLAKHCPSSNQHSVPQTFPRLSYLRLLPLHSGNFAVCTVIILYPGGPWRRQMASPPFAAFFWQSEAGSRCTVCQALLPKSLGSHLREPFSLLPQPKAAGWSMTLLENLVARKRVPVHRTQCESFQLLDIVEILPRPRTVV